MNIIQKIEEARREVSRKEFEITWELDNIDFGCLNNAPHIFFKPPFKNKYKTALQPFRIEYHRICHICPNPELAIFTDNLNVPFNLLSEDLIFYLNENLTCMLRLMEFVKSGKRVIPPICSREYLLVNGQWVINTNIKSVSGLNIPDGAHRLCLTYWKGLNYIPVIVFDVLYDMYSMARDAE